MKAHYLLFVLTVILLAGCQPSEGQPDQSSPPENTVTITPPMTSETPDSAAQNLIIQAQKKLADKLDMDSQGIFLFSVEAVEWPDASLGCPQTGMAYAQVVTPGYQILLEANGQVYTFHTNKTDQVILCDARSPDEIYLPP